MNSWYRISFLDWTMNPPDSPRLRENPWNQASPLAKMLRVSNSPIPSSGCKETESQRDNMAAPLPSGSGGNAKRVLDLQSDHGASSSLVRCTTKMVHLIFQSVRITLRRSNQGHWGSFGQKDWGSLGEVCDKLTEHDFEIGCLKDSLSQLQKENESMCNKLDELENRSRRRNVVLFGLPEAEKETAWRPLPSFCISLEFPRQTLVQ